MDKVYKNRTHIYLIIAISLIVYGNSLGNSFNWDDYGIIWENKYIADISLDNIKAIFTSIIFHAYQPFYSLSFLIDYSIWQLNPFGYHLTNLLLQTLNSIMVYMIINLILNNKKVSLMTALIFAVHPIHVESVTWISARKDVLSMFFFLYSFYLFIRYRNHAEKSNIYYYLGSLILFIFALLTKATTITLPLLFLLYEYSFTISPENTPSTPSTRARTNKFVHATHIFHNCSTAALQHRSTAFYSPLRRLIGMMVSSTLINKLKIYMPFFFISGAFMYLSIVIAHSEEVIKSYYGGGPFSTAITMTVVIRKYIQLLFFPVNLSAIYALPVYKDIFNKDVLSSLILLSIILFASVKTIKNKRLIFFCILWFFITLLPVLNIIPISTLMADRYMYIPSFAFCLLFATSFDNIFGLGPAKIDNLFKRIPNLIFVLIIVFLSLQTIKRNTVWQNDYTLWSDALTKYENSTTAHNNLGAYLFNKGMYKEAIREYILSLKNDSNNIDAHYNLALSYEKAGLLDKVLSEYQTIIRITPDDEKAHYNLATCYDRKLMFDNAIAEYKKAIKIRPVFKKARYNLKIARENKRIYKNVIETIQTNPDNPLPYIMMGDIYFRINLPDKALKEYKHGLELDKDIEAGHFGLGNVYERKGLPEKAIKKYEIALRLKPDSPDTHRVIGLIYGKYLRNNQKAIYHFKESLKLNPNQKQSGEIKKAIKELLN